ncbi:MAG: DNA pilot protein [Arizlama microvirus]|nr:MAG: DNA pilot protein [Arizlama microvirus]
MAFDNTFGWDNIIGIGNLAASGASSIMSARGADAANAMNYRIAQENRDWQERMSNTSHQRETADLRAAGLNPILSATGGSGASSPGGSTAVMQNPYETSAKLMSQGGINAATVRATNAMSALNTEKINTEKSQQALNVASAKAAGGHIGLPFGMGRFNLANMQGKATDFFKSGFNSVFKYKK